MNPMKCPFLNRDAGKVACCRGSLSGLPFLAEIGNHLSYASAGAVSSCKGIGT